MSLRVPSGLEVLVKTHCERRASIEKAPELAGVGELSKGLQAKCAFVT